MTPANEQERAQVDDFVAEVQKVTGGSVQAAFVDQGYTGVEPAAQAAKHGVELIVVKLAEAKRGFVLLPRRWVVERSFAWASRFRRLARDYERLPSSVAGLHWLAFLGIREIWIGTPCLTIARRPAAGSDKTNRRQKPTGNR